jgi:N-sulfoglucosamine sulfohydrolase
MARMGRFSAPLERGIVTFPELLRKAGYFTGVVGRTYHLDGHNIIASDATRTVFEEFALETFPDRFDVVKVADGGVGHISQFVEFLNANEEGKPWFCQLSFDDPHRPLDTNAIENPHDPSTLTLPPHYPDTPLLRQDLAYYYDEITRFDSDFARVLQILEERNLADNTVVVFMGDNGAAVLRAKGTLYEWGLNVPMIVRWKGVTPAGTSNSDLITSEDIAPTFLQIAGVAIPEHMEGPSFLEALKGNPVPNARSWFAASRGTHGYNLPLNTADFDLSRAVRTERFKLIYNPLWQIPFTPVDIFGMEVWRDLSNRHAMGQLPEPFASMYFSRTRPIFELYDLELDPGELRNLIAQPAYAAIEQDLKEKLHRWMVLNHDYVPLPIPDFNPFLKRE